MSNLKNRFSQRFVAMALPGLLFVPMASADSLDTLNVHLGSSVSYDKNLFHLSPSANTQALLGTSNRADTITATTLGLSINKPYSLQRFELDLNVVNYDYRRFDFLNFTAINYDAAWRWNLTPRLKGNLVFARQEALNNFSDSQNYRSRNVRVNESYRLDADLDVGGEFHLLGGTLRSVRTNSQTFIQERDNTVTSGEIGIRYDFTSGASLGFLHRSGRGSYDNLDQPLPMPVLLDNGFDQTESLVSMAWPITAKTSLNGRIGYLERKHDHYAARDFSGMVGGLNLNWEVTGNTRLNAGWTRNLSSYESRDSSYVTSDRFFISPLVQITAKTALRARYDYILQDYDGAIESTATTRSDKERMAMLALDWKPINALSLSASMTRHTRSSTADDRDFKDSIYMLGLRFDF
jgi:exopolysaccharide biosynthesis operon protein EpsL